MNRRQQIKRRKKKKLETRLVILSPLLNIRGVVWDGITSEIIKRNIIGMKTLQQTRKKSGFTLIEILVVIGIIAILAAIVIIAINPAKQFAQARNTQRQAGVNAILNAVGQRLADNKGVFAGDYSIGGVDYHCSVIPTAASTTILTANTTASGALGCLVPTYISVLPSDPQTGTAADTHFDIKADSTGRITVCASEAANETSIPGASAICVTR